MKQRPWTEEDFAKKALRDQAEWMDKASEQIVFGDEALEAIDRCLDLKPDDILVCESTCLHYATHALGIEGGLGELWLIPPRLANENISADLLNAFSEPLKENFGELLESLEAQSSAFKGLTASVPEDPFKMLITTQYVGVPIESATTWPKYNEFWIDMLNTESSIGAVIYPPADAKSTTLPSLREGNFDGNYYPGGFVRAVELASGHVVLAQGEATGTFLMEDLTNPNTPWTREVGSLELVVNDGCLIPSMIRAGVEVVKETTLGELASRISRGTTLSEKDLDVVEKLNGRIVEPPEEDNRGLPFKSKRHATGFSGGIYTQLDSWVYAEQDDLYYVDGSCFNKGEIWPTVLNSIPKGQERYIVDKHDGEVLLVSRNSKEPAVYEAIRPTLIGNSVFVIRLDSDISRAYLACWMRGSYAKSWMHDQGKALSKGVLSDLPVPILRDEVMEQTVRYESSIDEKIFNLREEIGKLESSNRFAPLAATKEEN